MKKVYFIAVVAVLLAACSVHKNLASREDVMKLYPDVLGKIIPQKNSRLDFYFGDSLVTVASCPPSSPYQYLTIGMGERTIWIDSSGNVKSATLVYSEKSGKRVSSRVNSNDPPPYDRVREILSMCLRPVLPDVTSKKYSKKDVAKLFKLAIGAIDSGKTEYPRFHGDSTYFTYLGKLVEIRKTIEGSSRILCISVDSSRMTIYENGKVVFYVLATKKHEKGSEYVQYHDSAIRKKAVGYLSAYLR